MNRPNAMTEKNILKRLNRLLEDTPALEISGKDKLVIFSDLHVGNKGSNDDFARNSDFFRQILAKYYDPRGYHLVLNGDIEELFRFSLKQIIYRSKEFYKLLERFHNRDALTKLVGNHDFQLLRNQRFLFGIPVLEALKLKWKEDYILLFHGHQAGRFNEFFNSIVTFIIRYFANPIGIGNYSVAFDSRKKYKLEKRVYDFAKNKKIIAMIGHTHRPLFESLSRVDNLKFQIERLCRVYPYANTRKQQELEAKIKRYKNEMHRLIRKETNKENNNSLYDLDPVVPCIFNSGCGIGKNGITAIEIANGTLQLVYWFDQQRSEKYFNFNGYKPKPLRDSSFWRVPLKKETLDYVFSRIKLLA